MDIQFLLKLALPPVLGGIIGWVTNSIAIKMLFRPYYKKKIFGIPIPLTPGVIPKQRYELADNIGKMVSNELITKDAIITQISSTKFETTLKSKINEIVDKIINSPIDNYLQKEINGISFDIFINKVTTNFLSSKVFKKIINLISENVLNSIVEPKNSDNFDSLESISQDIFNLPLDNFLKNTLHFIFSRLKNNDLTPKKKFSHLNNENFCEITKYLYIKILPSFTDFLDSKTVRIEIEKKSLIILEQVLNKLNSIQKFFVMAGQYDKTLEENIPGIVDDAINQLKNTLSEDDFINKLTNFLYQEFIKPNKISTSKMPVEVESKIVELIKNILMNNFKISSEDNLLKLYLNDYLKINTKTLSKNLTKKIIKYITNNTERISDYFNSQLYQLKDNTISDVININEQTVNQLIQWLYQITLKLIKDKTPQVLSHFDIYKLVVDKVNSLDVKSVESLILQVIQKHLKWINVFGGLLGFLIGLSQTSLNLFF